MDDWINAIDIWYKDGQRASACTNMVALVVSFRARIWIAESGQLCISIKFPHIHPPAKFWQALICHSPHYNLFYGVESPIETKLIW